MRITSAHAIKGTFKKNANCGIPASCVHAQPALSMAKGHVFDVMPIAQQQCDLLRVGQRKRHAKTIH